MARRRVARRREKIGGQPHELISATDRLVHDPASESLDPISKRGLDDWVTFYDASQRLIQTLQYSGFNALVFTVACEGSAIYPSRFLEPTPKYDSGVFFESGQDAVRKDILELLFRLCDRSGLVLIPGVQFAGPIPSLAR